ncbi:F-box/LRR-repeat protein 20-like [Ruditapes philippinarum]|uniref:F-box/LRR-repeat protein 20-like n=1 Tax=Ruditapes philippinarum TaxID=129788 RepID=UPI00295B5DCD|nr:F-box/LRR-repeat protein 20-like [Ruditapes philippinarum]
MFLRFLKKLTGIDLNVNNDAVVDMEPGITVMDLPPPVIVNIYSYLNPEDILSMRNICPLWNHLSYDASIWRELNTSNCTDSFLSNGSFCKLLHEVEAYIEVLHFDIEYISILDYLAQSEASYCQNLQEIHIFNEKKIGKTIDINGLDQKMVKLSQKCKQLKKLHYENLFINTDAVFDKLKYFKCSSDDETIDETLEEPARLKAFIQRHPQIEDLDIHLPALPDDNELSATSILLDLPLLKKLRLYDNFTDEEIPLLQPINHQLNLESLTLYFLSYVTDETIVAILTKVPKLKIFDVRYCDLVTDVTLKCVAKNCREITEFSIVGYHPVLFTGAGVKEVALNCTKVEWVTVIPCSDDDDEDIYAFISHCAEKLRLLVVSGGVTDRTILKMTEICPNIFYLDLYDCPKLTGASISAVLRCYKNLECLTLIGNSNIKTLDDFCEVEAIKVLKSDKQKNVERKCVVEEGKLKAVKLDKIQEQEQSGEKLEETVYDKHNGVVKTLVKSTETGKRLSFLLCLHMNGCYELTDNSLFKLACYCPNLRQVHLSGCVDLSDNTVKTFVQRCPFLSEFDISLEYAPENLVGEKVTDEGLADIARYGKKLCMIKLDFRDNITTEGLFELIRNCPIIQHVQISVTEGKSNLTKEKLMKFAEAYKQKFICMNVDGTDFGTECCLDIYISDKEPTSFSRKYFYFNFKFKGEWNIVTDKNIQ